ncbi:DNA-directed RNA polymerase subunit alpha [Streptomyces fumanus]
MVFVTEEVVDEFRSRFVIEPLEPGFGYTLGNSLRRTLLPRSPVPPSPASGSTACCTSSPPCRA